MAADDGGCASYNAYVEEESGGAGMASSQCMHAGAVEQEFSTVPAHLLARMRALLAGEDPDAKVALLAGFYTVELRDYLLANGFEVITCDYRHSEGPGMHYLGDVRNILQARTWTVLVGSPPCKNLSWSTACEYPTKRANGEQWYSLSFVALLYTARALHIIIELPGSCVAQFLRSPEIVVGFRYFTSSRSSDTGICAGSHAVT